MPDLSERFRHARLLKRGKQKMSGDDLCYAKAKQRGQKTFTLVEQDRTSVEAIAYWILLNIRTAPREKLQQALDDCIQWREFSVQKEAD